MEENEIVSVVKIKIVNYEVSVECAEAKGFVVLQKHTYIYKIYIYFSIFANLYVPQNY